MAGPSDTGSARPARRAFSEARLLLAAALLTAVGVKPTQDAVANGGNRSLTIYHAHTKEQETITYKRFGSFDSAGLQKLNWILRDWRQDEPTRMDPYLFDILWEVYRASGSSGPIHVVSAYRSPGTNAMLARRSRGVARNSQHMNGKAVDFNLPDVSMATVRDIGLRLQHGGVGYYPRANNPWVHLDTGGVRHWPKVSRDHLVKLFPDERTVHIPRDGKPLAGFETARAVIEARGGSVSSGYIDIAEGRATGKTLFQILFGGGEDEDTGPATRGRGRGRTAVAARQPAPSAADGDNSGSAFAFFQQNTPTQTEVAAVAPRGRLTRPVAAPEPQERPAEKPVTPTEAKPEAPPRAVEVAAVAPSPPRSADESATKGVNVVLPPRRPASFPEVGPVLAAIQLPPRRPDDLLTASVTEVARATPTEEPKTIARSVVVALPPARPAAMVAALQRAPEATKPAEPIPTNVTAFAPAAPRRPDTPSFTADRKALDSLISQISAENLPQKGGKVDAGSVTALTTGKVLPGRFEPQSPSTASPKSFSGAAIRPLRQGFQTTN